MKIIVKFMKARPILRGEFRRSNFNIVQWEIGMNASAPSQVNQTEMPLEGTYVTFELDNEEYCLGIGTIREIIRLMPVSKIPRMPDFIEGIINLRGNVIPIIDLRRRLALAERDYDDRTPIIIVELQTPEGLVRIGVIVDGVSEVIQVSGDEVEATPSFGVEIDADFILGLAKVENGIRTILDIEQVLTCRHLNVLTQMDRYVNSPEH